MKAPAGEEAEVNGCSCGPAGGCCLFTVAAFGLRSSERQDRTQIHRSGVCNDRTAREQPRASCEIC